VLAEAGFEADDLIATLATQAEDEGYRVLVVTGDRDALQLVSDDVTVAVSDQGRQRAHPLHARGRAEQVRPDPTQYPDFAALARRSSDNLREFPALGRRRRPSGSTIRVAAIVGRQQSTR